MERTLLYQIAADTILVLHFAFVVFVVVGLVMILIGGICRWAWVRNPYFRLLHLIAILIVAFQAWLGVMCPLTIWESSLRQKAGQGSYENSFIGHWLSEILFYSAPNWVFIVAYSLFASLVALSWYFIRPRSFRSAHVLEKD